jgi:acetylornithine deacetylase/succinyl-diaminopimelate desuccinylase-like protein
MNDELSTLREQPAKLLGRLIRFDTSNPGGDEGECIADIERLLCAAGAETRLVASSSERPNLIARIGGAGHGPPLLLQGHIDVVPAREAAWSHDPFGGEITDGYVWGRGALDMKGGVAMMVAACLRALADGRELPTDVVFAALVDEEAGSDHGAAFLVREHPELFAGVRYAIGEFGGFSSELAGRRFYPIQVAEKQICWLRATFTGPGGHGSMPVRGGATAKLAAAMAALARKELPVHITPVVRSMFEGVGRELPVAGRALVKRLMQPGVMPLLLRAMGERGRDYLGAMLRNTVSANVIHASEKINVVPDEAIADLDGRLLPGQRPADLIRELHEVIGGDVKLDVLRYDGGPDVPDLGLYDTLADILLRADRLGRPIPMLMPASSDARFFARLGIQTYGFLPMQLPSALNFQRLIHAVDERIPVEALAFGSDCLYQLLHRSHDVHR